MAVRLPTVRALCTEPELALVVASRKPELKLLKPAQVERLRERARKLVDKWTDLSRQQTRKQNRKVGAVAEDTRSHQKAEIFAEALAAFDSRLAELQGGSKAKPKPKPAAKKPARTAAHRATRADVRSSLKDKKLALNESARKPAAAPPPAKQPEPPVAAEQAAPAEAAAPSGKPVLPPRSRKALRPAPPAKGPASRPQKNPADQLAAVTAAKQARVARSGVTTRMKGHVASRTRKAQARRDSKQ
jgi:histone H1/5